ncbi:DUF3095 domain-containing protein [Sinorhizobium sp. BG8]|uniref:DUF3095 domain-containing protein n=1 Tax=Sinorhizobium sp. BG8 TaxID=2613773 RepID=UPI00193D3CA4|nr:DUF3095 domain-containing protein [Sinorhizobium sp. BG8]QRM54605.1 DUF3095 domain-containing protein [Sinorhizobium sp. BG8]
MGESDRDTFYATLPAFTDFSGVADGGNYHPLPEGWVLAVADIVDSTGAVAAGRYKAVNMAGAGVISAVLNAIGQHDLPYVFGGDGALVAVPPSAIGKARLALAAIQTWVREEMQLVMRAALVDLSEIRNAGHDVRIARYKVNDFVSYAMFAGGGSNWAECRMKEGLYGVEPATPGTRPDLTGLSCRWNPIRARHGSIVSIIALPTGSAADREFQALVTDIIAIASSEERAGHPVAVETLELGLSKEGMDAEVRATAPPNWRLRLRARLMIILQYVLMVWLLRIDGHLGRFNAKVYRADVAGNSDFRKFDDGLKMTLDVGGNRLAAIEARLAAAVRAGVCRYGLHKQDSALMTCVVPTPMSRDHVHFIDGAAGGYAIAASQLKAAAAAPPHAVSS